MANVNLNKVAFITPCNDAESHEIVEMLMDAEAMFCTTAQGWGASWDKLNEEDCVFLNSMLAEGRTVYGVELQGEFPAGCVNPNNCINIDHHNYDGDNRYNVKSAIEQVADILGVKLNHFQSMVSANDTGWIPGMISKADKLGLNDHLRDHIIDQVRELDRKMQGISVQHEGQALRAIENMEVCGDLHIIRSPHSKCACYTDRLYGKYTNLLILSEDGESNFYGRGDACILLHNKFGGWSGGQLPISGFWGGYPNQTELEVYVKELLK